MYKDIQNYKKNEVIFREGDCENWMYDIIEGKIGIYIGYGTPEEKRLTVLLPGQFCGEMGLIERLPRSADAVALDDKTRLVKISEADFEEYFTGKTEKMMELMQNMSFRIRALTEDYLNACRALSETVEAEADEEKKVTAREKFKKFLHDLFVMSALPENGASPAGIVPYIPGHHWDYSVYKLYFNDTNNADGRR